jgi:hypothetical protein
MPWNGSGEFVLSQNFPNDRDLGPPTSLIDADKVHSELTNIKEGLERCLTTDGQTTPVANINMGGYTLVGLASATQSDQPVAARQISDGQLDWVGVMGGTPDNMTGSLLFAPSALTAGVRVRGIVLADNTTSAVTFKLNGLAPVSVKRSDGTNLQPRDLRVGREVSMFYNGTEFRVTSPLTPDGRGQPIFATKDAAVDAVFLNYTCNAVDDTFTAYANGQSFVWTAPAHNAGPSTLAISGLGILPLVGPDGVSLAPNAIENGTTYILHCVGGTSLRIVSSTANALPTAPTLDLDQINDVDTTGTADGHVLTRNSGVWRSAPPAAASSDPTKVSKTGDIMTGPLTIRAGAGTNSTVLQFDAQSNNPGGHRFELYNDFLGLGSGVMALFDRTTGIAPWLARSSGHLEVALDPVNPLGVVTKRYIDTPGVTTVRGIASAIAADNTAREALAAGFNIDNEIRESLASALALDPEALASIESAVTTKALADGDLHEKTRVAVTAPITGNGLTATPLGFDAAAMSNAQIRAVVDRIQLDNGAGGALLDLQSSVGGGTISDAFMDGLTQLASGSIDSANDRIPIQDSSGNVINYVTPSQLAGSSGLTDAYMDGLTQLATASLDKAADRIPIQDSSGNVINYVTPSQLAGLSDEYMDGLTALATASIDLAADRIPIQDESGNVINFVTPNQLLGLSDEYMDGLTPLATASIDFSADRIPIQDASGNVINYVTPASLVADMPAWTFKARNNAALGVPQDVTMAGFAAESNPAATRIILTADPSTGEPRKSTLAELKAIVGGGTGAISDAGTPGGASAITLLSQDSLSLSVGQASNTFSLPANKTGGGWLSIHMEECSRASSDAVVQLQASFNGGATWANININTNYFTINTGSPFCYVTSFFLGEYRNSSGLTVPTTVTGTKYVRTSATGDQNSAHAFVSGTNTLEWAGCGPAFLELQRILAGRSPIGNANVPTNATVIALTVPTSFSPGMASTATTRYRIVNSSGSTVSIGRLRVYHN